MASSFSFWILTIAFAFFLFVQGTLGVTNCENLEPDSCAFAVSWSGKRCLLEKRVKRTGEDAYICRTSEIEADPIKDYIETDQCVKACGLDRKSLGISSDALFETPTTQKLCSPQCYDNCPNVVVLFFNLAAGEGVFLPTLCKAQGENARREMAEIRKSGIVTLAEAPDIAPAAAPF